MPTAATAMRFTSEVDRPLDLHDFLLFGLEHLIDLLHGVVVQLLDFLLAVALVVFRDMLGLLRLVDPFGPRMAHRDAAFLGQLVHPSCLLLSRFRSPGGRPAPPRPPPPRACFSPPLPQLFAPFLRERGQR